MGRRGIAVAGSGARAAPSSPFIICSSRARFLSERPARSPATFSARAASLARSSASFTGGSGGLGSFEPGAS